MSFSSMEAYAIEEYVRLIDKYDVLTADEEKRLALKIQEGDKEAFFKLFLSNLRLVFFLVKKFLNKNNNHQLYFWDLVQEGNLALLKAVRKFDIQKGIRFSTYASIIIKQSFFKLASNISIISYKDDSFSLLNKIRKDFLDDSKDNNILFDEFIKDNPCIPPRLLAFLKLQKAEFYNLYECEENLDYTFNKLEEDPAYLVERKFLKEIMADLLNFLNDRERKILELKYGLLGECFSFRQISELLGVSKTRVYQIEKRALRKLRRILEEKGLDYEDF